MELRIDRSNWQKVKLGDVAFEYSKRINNPSDSDFDRFVGSSNIGQWDFRIRSWESTDSVTSSMKLFEPNDYLLVRRSLYASDFRERAPRADFAGVCSGDILTIKENPDMVVDGFLIGIFNSPSLWKFVVANASGSITRRIKWKDLANYEFLLPPKGQQAQFAELLWAMDEVVEKVYRIKKKHTILYESFLDDTIKMLRDKYPLTRLEAIIDNSRPVTYGILKPGKGYPGGIPVIKVRDYPNGNIVKEGLLHTSPEIEAPYKRSRLKEGDLLLSIRGTVGRLAEVPKSLQGANITQDTARLAITDSINHLFIRAILESSFIQRQIRTRTTGLAVQGINLGEVRKLMLPVPDILTQNIIALKFKRLQHLTTEVKSKINTSKALQKSLINQIF